MKWRVPSALMGDVYFEIGYQFDPGLISSYRVGQKLLLYVNTGPRFRHPRIVDHVVKVATGLWECTSTTDEREPRFSGWECPSCLRSRLEHIVREVLQ